MVRLTDRLDMAIAVDWDVKSLNNNNNWTVLNVLESLIMPLRTPNIFSIWLLKEDKSIANQERTLR